MKLLLCMMAVGLLAAAGTPSLAAPPLAPPPLAAPATGWEFARWGMTPDQLRLAAHGRVRSAGPNAGYDTLVGASTMGPFRFKVVFDYAPRPEDPGNNSEANLVLDGVTLDLDAKSGTCAELTTYLKRTLGKPDRTTTVGYLDYDWSKKGLGADIDLHVDPTKGCAILYSPSGTE